MSDPKQSQTLSVVAHVSALFSSVWVSVLVPILLLLMSEDEVVKANARQSLNFQINIIIWSIVSLILCLVVVGFVLLFVVAAASIIMPIIATIKCASNPGTVYRYPLCFPILD